MPLIVNRPLEIICEITKWIPTTPVPFKPERNVTDLYKTAARKSNWDLSLPWRGVSVAKLWGTFAGEAHLA
jgi:hypothetical protein